MYLPYLSKDLTLCDNYLQLFVADNFLLISVWFSLKLINTNMEMAVEGSTYAWSSISNRSTDTESLKEGTFYYPLITFYLPLPNLSSEFFVLKIGIKPRITFNLSDSHKTSCWWWVWTMSFSSLKLKPYTRLTVFQINANLFIVVMNYDLFKYL